MVTSVSRCRVTPSACIVRVEHTIVEGANRYIVEGPPGAWSSSCGNDDDCTIVFTVSDPPQQCTFTLRAARGNEIGPPSMPFCVPGTDDVRRGER